MTKQNTPPHIINIILNTIIWVTVILSVIIASITFEYIKELMFIVFLAIITLISMGDSAV